MKGPPKNVFYLYYTKQSEGSTKGPPKGMFYFYDTKQSEGSTKGHLWEKTICYR